MPSSRFLIVVLLMSCLITGSSPAQDLPFKLPGCAYGPFRDGQSPGGIYPSADQMSEDLELLRGLTYAIRTYSVEETLAALPGLAKKKKLACFAGAWLSTDAKRNERELTTLIALARRAKPKALIVGNEALLRGDVTPSALVQYVQRAREESKRRIGVAEPWSTWLGHPSVAEAVDIIFVHIHPYWDGIAIESAAEYVRSKWIEVKQMYPTKEIIVGETGWPTAGLSVGAAVPSEANQARFLRELVTIAAAEDLPYFLLQFADEAWKIQATGIEAEGHWGLMDSGRTLKSSIGDFFSDPPPIVEFTKTAGCGAVVLAGKDCYGRVSGILKEDRGRYNVILYSFTDRWYLQPEVNFPYLRIGSRGGWRVRPHKGTQYAALLVAEQYLPAPVLTQLPTVGGEVLAISVAACGR